MKIYVRVYSAKDKDEKLMLPVNVVVELVVAGKRKQNSKARSKGEEDLRSCINPYLVQTQRHAVSQCAGICIHIVTFYSTIPPIPPMRCW